MTSFTETWNGSYEGLPPDTVEAATQGAARIRSLKLAVRERVAVDHSIAGDAHDGKHNKVTLRVQGADPTLDATDGGVYIKAVGGVNELFYKDSAGTVRQLTSAGALTPFVDTSPVVVGSGDATKKIRFEVDGLTTGVTRVITVPNFDVNLGDWSTGDVKLTLKTVADTGWVMCNDGTIGNAASGGTTRANADTVNLFTLLWDNVADAQAAVSGGRGANAAADYAANKTIALTKMLGRAFGSAGAGAGLTSRVLGLATGTETHTLTAAESGLPSHVHREQGNLNGSPVGAESPGGSSGTAINSLDIIEVIDVFPGVALNTQATGGSSGSAHNNMQPTAFVNAMIKL